MIPTTLDSDPTTVSRTQASATVVLMRDGSAGLEVLLVERAKGLSAFGGLWVFPGGKLEPGDGAGETASDTLLPFRRAAIREVLEETGLVLNTGDLVPLSRWITPIDFPRRFDTWFFAARSHTAAATVDGGEIRSHMWLSPVEAIRRQKTRELPLPPPTFVTLERLCGLSGVDAALSAIESASPPCFFPRIVKAKGGQCFLYAEDVAYRNLDLDRKGPRHRLWAIGDQWRYETPETAARSAL